MKNDELILVIFEDNWADEMDVTGFRIMKAGMWESLKKEAETVFAAKSEVEVWFGTNESNSYRDSETFLGCFTVKKIDKKEFAFLKKNFSRCDTYGFGHFPTLEDQAYEIKLEEKKAKIEERTRTNT